MASEIIPIVEDHNTDDEQFYGEEFMFVKGYSCGRNLLNTLKALPLARQIHNGQYRQGTVTIKGVEYRLPYVLHVLKVANTLISISLPLTDSEMDILLSCALLHDAIEDNGGYLKNGGREIVTEYGISEKVYSVIKLLSKRHGATEAELNLYFNEIKRDKYALLVKMADRSHNVEDLYTKLKKRQQGDDAPKNAGYPSRSSEKLHKYVKETRDYIYPLSTYAKAHYPELSNGVTILKSKIVSLTELTETLVNQYDQLLLERDSEIERLKEENGRLKARITDLENTGA